VSDESPERSTVALISVDLWVLLW